jgi:hypothetical protein
VWQYLPDRAVQAASESEQMTLCAAEDRSLFGFCIETVALGADGHAKYACAVTGQQVFRPLITAALTV